MDRSVDFSAGATQKRLTADLPTGCAGDFLGLCYSPNVEKVDKTQLTLECICLLREFGRKPFDLIDRVLGLDPGHARKTHEKHHDAYQAWTKKYAADALHRFYQDQITVLESLSTSMPASIGLWQNILNDPTSKQADREKAARAILDWTKLFLASKEKAGLRELIPKALLEVHDKAEELGGHLTGMLGSALDIDSKEESN